MNQLDDEQVRREKLLYLALCSEQDRRCLNLEEDLALPDFERIAYLLQALGFQNFLLEFEQEHKDLLSQAGQKIAERLEKQCDTALEIAEADKWVQEFCSGHPDPIIQYHLEMLLHVDKGE